MIANDLRAPTFAHNVCLALEIAEAGRAVKDRSRVARRRAPMMFRFSLSQPITCPRQPTHRASRVRVRPALLARRQRSSTLSSTLSTVVLDCATSICQRRRGVYGKCLTEFEPKLRECESMTIKIAALRKRFHSACGSRWRSPRCLQHPLSRQAPAAAMRRRVGERARRKSNRGTFFCAYAGS